MKELKRHCRSLGTSLAGRSDQDCAKQYRERIPGGDRWQERLVLLVVNEINRDVRHEGFVL